MDPEVVIDEQRPAKRGPGSGTTKKIANAVDKFFAALNDQSDKRVFGRLMSNDRSLEALAAITKTDSDLNRVLLACLQSEDLARTFHKRLANECEVIKRAEKLKKSITELASFLDQETSQSNLGRIRNDRLSAVITLHNDDKEKVLQAFDIVADVISARRRVASETLLRYGKTRNSAPKNKKAAQTAAIGWLAEAIEKIAGKPLTRHVAVLAEAILGLRDVVTIERVREALKTRSARDWRGD
jgi:hypothetical protein